MTHATTALVFVLSRHLLNDAARCIEYCRCQGYSMIGVVKDDWAEAMRMLHQERVADVVVVADRQHLDPRRAPRVEVVADHGTGGRPKTQIIRRNAGA